MEYHKKEATNGYSLIIHHNTHGLQFILKTRMALCKLSLSHKKHHMKFILPFILFLSLSQFISAQENCKVLLHEIDSIYIGKCKKGYAHGKGTAIGKDSYTGKFTKGWPNGKGTYTWANGDIYTGGWIEGKRNGNGKLTLKLADRDSILDGLWKEDMYLGPKPKAPSVITKTSIERHSFQKLGKIHNRVLINFLQSGGTNNTITNLSINASSGEETNLGNSIGYEFVKFPVIIRVSYATMNKLNTLRYQAIFEFEITEPGDWLVKLHN